MSGIPELIERRIDAERKLIADWLASENRPDQIRLRGGELSAQEMRAVQAFVTFAEMKIRNGECTQKAKTE
jgi:hypothetical protein